MQPSSERVAKRAMVLAALVCRGFIELDSPSEVEELRASLLPWIDKVGARQEMERHELVALTAPLGTLDEQVQINLVWAVEGLAVLAWAMKRYDLHPNDTVAEPQSITSQLHLLNDSAKNFVDNAILRDSEEIKKMRDTCYTTHCQLKEFVSNPINADKLNSESFHAKNSISRERMRASLWLVGDSELYSEVNIAV